jgi:hypothetical protein
MLVHSRGHRPSGSRGRDEPAAWGTDRPISDLGYNAVHCNPVSIARRRMLSASMDSQYSMGVSPLTLRRGSLTRRRNHSSRFEQRTGLLCPIPAPRCITVVPHRS